MTPYLEEETEYLESFTNDQVNDFNLPQIATLEYSPLELNLRKADMIWSILFFMIAAGIVLALKYIFQVEWVVSSGHYILLGIAFLLTLSLLFIYYEFRRKSYAIRQKDIVYNSGLFWQSSIVIPFNRVQHCEVSQGPIDRFYNLAELKVFTAGGSSSDLKIDGLNPETAARIKDFIVTKTGMDEEE